MWICLWLLTQFAVAQPSTPSAADPVDVHCRDNLQTLLHAIEKYARTHNGRYPSMLSELVPDQLKELPVCEAGGEDSYSLYSVLDEEPPRAVLICAYPGHRINGIDYLVISSDRGTETPFLRTADPVPCRRTLLALREKLATIYQTQHKYPPRLDEIVRCSCGDPIQYWVSADGETYQAYCPGAAHLGAGLAPFNPRVDPTGLQEQNLLLSPPGQTVHSEPPPQTPTWMLVLAGVAFLVILVLAFQWLRPKAVRLD